MTVSERPRNEIVNSGKSCWTWTVLSVESTQTHRDQLISFRGGGPFVFGRVRGAGWRWGDG